MLRVAKPVVQQDKSLKLSVVKPVVQHYREPRVKLQHVIQEEPGSRVLLRSMQATYHCEKYSSVKITFQTLHVILR